MIIPISDKYRIIIITDQYQFIVQKSAGTHKSDVISGGKVKHRAGDPAWIAAQYFPTLEEALLGLIRADFRAVTDETLADALNRQEILVKAIQKALKPKFELIVNESA